MSIQRIPTVQGHPIVQGYHGGGFDIPTRSEDILRDYEVEEFPPGATCLNGMTGVELWVCEDCGRDVAEAEFDGHVC